jgi:hypothetical protein
VWFRLQICEEKSDFARKIVKIVHGNGCPERYQQEMLKNNSVTVHGNSKILFIFAGVQK